MFFLPPVSCLCLTRPRSCPQAPRSPMTSSIVPSLPSRPPRRGAGRDLKVLRLLLPFVWPKGDRGMKLRLVLSLSLLAATALVNRSEEHTSELQSLKRISYAVFFWKKKKYI